MKIFAFILLLGLVFNVTACSFENGAGSKSPVGFNTSEYVPWKSSYSAQFQAESGIKPKLEDKFDTQQQYFIDLAENLYIVGFSLGENITDVDKARFFNFVISTDSYADQLKDWKKERTDKAYYEIPLKDIEKIISSHLNTKEFDPLVGFINKDKSDSNHIMQWYDTENRVYITSNIGGYGGAAALGVLSYETNENQIKIILGSYDMEKYYQDPQKYQLLETYETTFLLQSDKLSDYKIISAQIHDGIN